MDLPYGWEYQESTDCVVCGGCGFRFGAEHPNHDDTWTCPVCGDGDKTQVTDEGALKMAVAYDKLDGIVRVEFGKPVAWLGLSPPEALQLAERIAWHARKAKL